MMFPVMTLRTAHRGSGKLAENTGRASARTSSISLTVPFGEYDEFNIGVQFKAAATVSITYALMSRWTGQTLLRPRRFHLAIFDFNTVHHQALGTAVSQINQQGAAADRRYRRNAGAEAGKKGANKMNNPMTISRTGDYLIPDLKLSRWPEKTLGKYGRIGKPT